MTNCNKTEKKHEFSYACRAFPYRQCSSTPSLGSVKRPPGSSAGDGTPSVLHGIDVPDTCEFARGTFRTPSIADRVAL